MKEGNEMDRYTKKLIRRKIPTLIAIALVLLLGYIAKLVSQ